MAPTAKQHTGGFPRAIGNPATDALNVAGFHTLADLTKATEAQLMALHGFGPKALSILRETLAEQGLSFAASFPKGVSQPATRALNGAGYHKLEDLTNATESELMALHGFGHKALTALRDALAEKGLSFKKA